VLSALLGIGGGLFYPASFAMTPYLVRRDDLQAANSFEQLTNQVSNFAGPGLAGIVLGAARLALGFVIDAASFAVSVLSLLFIRVQRQEVAGAREEKAQQAGGRGGMSGLVEAFRYLRRTRFLATLLSLSIVANFGVTGMFEVAIPLLLKQLVGVEGGPQALGIVVSAFGLGSILGVVLAGVANKVRHKPIVGVVLFVPISGLIAWMPFVGSVYGLAGIFAVAGLLLGASNVFFITAMQRSIPMELMGRMMAFMLLGSFVGGPLSIFAYGVAATLVPAIAWLFIGGGSIIAIVGAFALTNRVIWQAE
jgi:MFS family permease